MQLVLSSCPLSNGTPQLGNSSPQFLAQPAPKSWHPSVDLQFWEKFNYGFSMVLLQLS